MSSEATDRIRHYHNLLVQHHRFVGGAVLQGYGLATRSFHWQQGDGLYAWGMDYSPHQSLMPWIDKLIVGPEYDKELGIPGTPVSEAWLSMAQPIGKTASLVTRYEYGTGALRGIDPYIAVSTSNVNLRGEKIEPAHIRGGLGFWRGIPELPRTTTNPGHAERLATELQRAASHIISISYV